VLQGPTYSQIQPDAARCGSIAEWLGCTLRYSSARVLQGPTYSQLRPEATKYVQVCTYGQMRGDAISSWVAGMYPFLYRITDPQGCSRDHIRPDAAKCGEVRISSWVAGMYPFPYRTTDPSGC
jgi:hypothetical protein